MFCTKCGKQLHDGDKFCAYCGAKVREAVESSPQPAHTYEEVVFNPPFRQEAEKRTRQITEESPYSSEPKRERIHFDWNLDGFPSRDSRKEDDFELNWEEVIEKRREPGAVNVEKIVPAADNEKDMSQAVGENELQTQEGEKHPEKDEALSIADLERELFGSDALSDISGDEKGMTIEYSRSSIPDRKNQFNTYNTKRDAFQELIDKERERIRTMESQLKSEWEEITPDDAKSKEIKEPPSFEDVFVEPATPLVPPMKEVAVTMAPLTLAVSADEENDQNSEKTATEYSGIAENAQVIVSKPENISVLAETAETEADPVSDNADTDDAGREEQEMGTTDEENKEENKAHEAAQQTEDKILSQTDLSQQSSAKDENKEEESFSPSAGQKTKLRYSDVFPADAFGDDTDGSGHISDDVSADGKKAESEDEEGEEEYKGNKVLKIIIAILAVMVAVELIIIGTKAFFPESGFVQTVDGIMTKITSVFSGDEGQSEGTESPEGSNNEYMHQYVNEMAGSAENIGSISYNEDLKYDPDKTYAFEEISSSEEFSDTAAGFSSDPDMTYGKAITEAAIGYYNNWQDKNKDENLIGINSLEIGEIRTGDNRFYVLTRTVYAASDGGTVSVLQTISLNKTDDGVIVDEVKEESV